MKDDIEMPARVPAKRRQLEQALDRWIAVWLAGDTLTPSERRRLEAEKARRKALEPDHRVGLLVGPEGVTPEQWMATVEALYRQQPTEIHHPGVARNLHEACRRIAPVIVHQVNVTPGEPAPLRAVVKASQSVVGAVRSMAPEGTSVWEAVRYAKHRRLPATVVLPDGQLHQGDT